MIDSCKRFVNKKISCIIVCLFVICFFLVAVKFWEKKKKKFEWQIKTQVIEWIHTQHAQLILRNLVKRQTAIKLMMKRFKKLILQVVIHIWLIRLTLKNCVTVQIIFWLPSGTSTDSFNSSQYLAYLFSISIFMPWDKHSIIRSNVVSRDSWTA